MPEKMSWLKTAGKGIVLGFLTILFSYLPTIIVGVVKTAQTTKLPSFCFFFNNGGMISIWIPILVMLMFSYYEIKANSYYPGWEQVVFVSVLLMAILLTALYVCFFYELVKYGQWAIWMSSAVVLVLFASLSFYKYLDLKDPKDLPTTRKEDQDDLLKRVPKE